MRVENIDFRVRANKGAIANTNILARKALAVAVLAAGYSLCDNALVKMGLAELRIDLDWISRTPGDLATAIANSVRQEIG